VIACLAGGAQLHSRENIEAVGGRIDTTTLAEDTVTTFRTQRAGRTVVFEPHATVWAEEPGSIVGLWKQRVRWARGNVQVTRMFRDVWFRHQAGNRLGSISFGLLWFCLLLLPVFMVCASASLITLFFINFQLAWTAFHVLWLTNVITYIFITSFALLIDPAIARHTWRQAVMFPGAINLLILLTAVLPGPMAWLSREIVRAAGFSPSGGWGPRHRAVHLHLARGLHGRGVPGQGGRAAPVRPGAQPVLRLHRRLRPAALRHHHGRLREGAPGRRPALGQDGEDGQDGGATYDRSPDQPDHPGRAAFPGAPPSAPSFDDEIDDAVRYEKGLAVKALLAIALVALVLAVRVYFFG